MVMFVPLDPARQRLCDDLRSAIADERDAVEMYKKLESKLNESDNPAVRALGLTVWGIKTDEEKHKKSFEDIERLLCRTF